MGPVFVIAIDGPAASGKGTLARRLARHYGLRHLDSGLTYRAVARTLIAAGSPLTDEALAVEAADAIDPAKLDRALLSDHAIAEGASIVAAMPKVRAALLQMQRSFAERPPGAVIDGRDIGTVVCPDADVKLFVTASASTRAQRRHAEIISRGGEAVFQQVLDDIRERDARDASRAISPMRPAPDAHLIDTTSMDIETAFRTALAIVENKRRAETPENGDAAGKTRE
jgi:CMP/dCMP kinase